MYEIHIASKIFARGTTLYHRDAISRGRIVYIRADSSVVVPFGTTSLERDASVSPFEAFSVAAASCISAEK